MSTDQAVRLRAVLDDLENGRITPQDAAAAVRTMHFPVPPPKTVAQRIDDADGGDLNMPPQPGSFHEVAAAYASGRIDLNAYELMAHAAVEAMGNDAQQEAS